jgi:5-methylcytosine-specific restriction endonuclease McrA
MTTPRSKGRTGRPWRRARARVLATQTVCWLCGQPVDRSLPWPHPMSATIDHRVALAAGGAELDPANLALAHFGCNSSKGDGTRVPGMHTSRAW